MDFFGSPRRRHARVDLRPDVEALEGRICLSATTLHSLAQHASTADLGTGGAGVQHGNGDHHHQSRPSVVLSASGGHRTRPGLHSMSTQAPAAPPTLIQVSSPNGSPFPSPSGNGGGSATLYVDAEVEPRGDVNPTNPKNIVIAYQQDRWSSGGAQGLVAAYTMDGGKTWSYTWAHFSKASGGSYDRVSDPWVSFAPNGDLYQIGNAYNVGHVNNASAILVSKSTNGGQTWSNPKALITETSTSLYNDKESITADPTTTNGSNVYAVWDQTYSGSRSRIEFARTTNGGKTWGPASTIFDPGQQSEFVIGNIISVLPASSSHPDRLVDSFTIDLRKQTGSYAPGWYEGVVTSDDQGQTWSAPNLFAPDPLANVVDPVTGASLRTSDGSPDVAVDPKNGNIYAVWEQQFGSDNFNSIALSMSSDGGQTWSTPVKINQTPIPVLAFTPSVHVAADGTVGVSYYDLRNYNPSDPSTLWTDAFLVQSKSPITSTSPWTETRLTPTSFDMLTAPQSSGYFVGDYEGLTGFGNSFMPIFVQANNYASGKLPSTASGPTDVFTTTVPAL